MRSSLVGSLILAGLLAAPGQSAQATSYAPPPPEDDGIVTDVVRVWGVGRLSTALPGSERTAPLKTQREFYLTRFAEAGTLEVEADVRYASEWLSFTFELCPTSGPDGTCDAVYDLARNSVRFLDWSPPPGTRVRLTYRVAPFS